MNYVKKHFRFIPDKGEYLIPFTDVINTSRWMGDCDDASLILSSLMASVGIPNDIVIVGNSDAAYHAIVMSDTYSYDVTGVVTPFATLYRKFAIWGRYPVYRGGLE